MQSQKLSKPLTNTNLDKFIFKIQIARSSSQSSPSLGIYLSMSKSNSWQIFPKQPTQKWKLQQSEERWILIVSDIPQLLLHTSEAIAFLKRYRPKQSN